MSGRDATQPFGELRPGDSVRLPDGQREVRTVLRCRETRGESLATWSWIFVEDSSMLELRPDGIALYRRHQVLVQGSSLYELLVAQDGVLVRFEERRQAGTAGRRPVRVTLNGREYRVAATGTVAATCDGDQPALHAWRSLGADNVYFRLHAVGGDELALGLWTDDVCLSFGQPLEP